MGVETEKGGIVHAANSNAFMTGFIFDKWMKPFNLWMHGRKGPLFLYNAFSHKFRRELNNVTGFFSHLTWLLPSNRSIQLRVKIMIYTCAPICMVINIIRYLIACYKKFHTWYRMDLIEANMEHRLNVLEAVEFASESRNTIGGVSVKFLDQE